MRESLLALRRGCVCCSCFAAAWLMYPEYRASCFPRLCPVGTGLRILLGRYKPIQRRPSCVPYCLLWDSCFAEQLLLPLPAGCTQQAAICWACGITPTAAAMGCGWRARGCHARRRGGPSPMWRCTGTACTPWWVLAFLLFLNEEVHYCCV
jgi:hypothetical protein